MKNNNFLYCFALATIFLSVQTNAQTEKLSEKQLQRWSHLDSEKDNVPGMNVDKAYAKLLKGKKGKTVIVGVLDSGVDVEHEDLKANIWTNKKEIDGNGKDDDNNGYVDDIHGWNFLGKILKEKYEYERIAEDKSLTDEKTYNSAKAIMDKKKEDANMGAVQLQQMMDGTEKADKIIANFLGKPTYTEDDLKKINSDNEEVMQSKQIMSNMLGFGMPIPDLLKEMKKEYDGYVALNANAKTSKEDYRKVVGDKPNDLKDVKYGDNRVMSWDSTKGNVMHGTHVAGIIGGVRNNKKGGDGIANNVKIMAIRAVPDGDEYDKDIALGIRYAVDNGAKVINGSFGKSFSPHKQWVYDAIKYAESKDVLIVHAAGNDGHDIDVEDNFPNDSDNKIDEFADNVLTIGALNYDTGNNLVANFSNYGKANVDVFAPGVKIYASVPNNKYQYLQGTSMAAPNAAGVAALIRSYYPNLKASQVKHILMDSGTEITSDVIVGGKPDDKRPFSQLSVSGKIVNAYNALQMAEKMSKNIKLKMPLKN